MTKTHFGGEAADPVILLARTAVEYLAGDVRAAEAH